jgi:CheY-like chemotaxis protein
VVIVDDNELTADGFAAALTRRPEIELVASLTHAEALAWDEQWREVDVVLVDAADETQPADHFPGVQVVRRVRACQGDRRPVVVVVTAQFMNDGLRHRMAHADADFFFLRSDFRRRASLADVVLRPEDYRRGTPAVADPERLRALGLSQSSRVEELVSYVHEHGLEAALDPASPHREDPRSRRWSRYRREIAKAAGIEPVNLTTGHVPYGNQSAPSLRQLRGIYKWAARVPPSDRTDGGKQAGGKG